MAVLAPKVHPAKHCASSTICPSSREQSCAVPEGTVNVRDMWRCEVPQIRCHPPRILPVPPRPASKLGCLGSSAGGSEGLATPSTVQDHGQGLRGPVAEELSWQGAAPRQRGHIPLCVAAYRGASLSPDIHLDHVSWAGGFSHILPPLLNLGMRKICLCHGKTGEVSGVLPQLTRIL